MKINPLALDIGNPFYIGILEISTCRRYPFPLLGVYISDGLVAVYFLRREFVIWGR